MQYLNDAIHRIDVQYCGMYFGPKVINGMIEWLNNILFYANSDLRQPISCLSIQEAVNMK